MKNIKWTLLTILMIATAAMAADKYISSSGDIVLKTATGKKVNLQDTLYTTQSGYVGVGTSTPSVQLHVGGTGNKYVRVSSDTHSNFAQMFSVSGSTGTEYKSVYRLVDTDNGERMQIDSSGRVGIGGAPSYPLHIIKDLAGQQAAVLKNASTNGSAASAWVASNGTNEIRLLRSGTNYSSYGDFTSADGALYSDSSMILMSDNASGVIKFATGGNAEKMRIDNAGKVGIGTTGPANKLHVNGSGAKIELSDTANATGQLMFYTTNATYYNFYTGPNEANEFQIGLAGTDSTPNNNTLTPLLRVHYTFVQVRNGYGVMKYGDSASSGHNAGTFKTEIPSGSTTCDTQCATDESGVGFIDGSGKCIGGWYWDGSWQGCSGAGTSTGKTCLCMGTF